MFTLKDISALRSKLESNPESYRSESAKMEKVGLLRQVKWFPSALLSVIPLRDVKCLTIRHLRVEDRLHTCLEDCRGPPVREPDPVTRPIRF
jgi:hypothetical protein